MIPYQLIRSRRKTVSIQITPTGEILVRCPLRLSRQTVDAFIQEKQPWIEAHLAKQAAQGTAIPLTPEEQERLAAQARLFFQARVDFYAPKVGTDYGRITVRMQRTRWGSCSAKGNLSFNCLLMLCPQEVRDYVVVHELCHRLEMNHSRRFWAQVQRALPEYAASRKWLREHGDSLIARLPLKPLAER